jgi:long-chain acyl-CoA synthetase
MIPSRTNPRTIPQLLELRATQTPDGPAFRDEDAQGQWKTLSWGAFAGQVRKLSRALFAAGLRKGDRLALISPVSLQWELLHHAALALGAVVVGLDAHDLPERLSVMSELADVSAFAVADPRSLTLMGKERLARARFVLELTGPGIDLRGSVRQLSWAELLALGALTSLDPPPPEGDDLATIIFTSGTTGAPKAIAYSHAQLYLAVEAICDSFAFIGPDGGMLCWLPLSNLFQRVVNLAAVRNGPVTHLLDDPRRVMQVVATVSPDVFIGVPRFFEKLLEGVRTEVAAQPLWRRTLVQWAWNTGRKASSRRLAGYPLPPTLMLAQAVAERLVLRRVRGVMGERLRCMVSGSAPAPAHLLGEFHALGWPVLEAYGLSENVLPMAMNRLNDFRLGSVGRPVKGNEIDVAEDGAIRVRGPGVFTGYMGELGQPGQDADGFYPTGDIGYFDADGYLYLTGRSSDLIKTSTGRRIAPAAVEALLLKAPGLDQAVVIGNGRKYLVALGTCLPCDQEEPARAQLEHALRQAVAGISPHERPRGMALLTRAFSLELGELTPNMKLRRAAIEERHAQLIDSLCEEIDRQAASGGPEFVVI